MSIGVDRDEVAMAFEIAPCLSAAGLRSDLPYRMCEISVAKAGDLWPDLGLDGLSWRTPGGP